MRYINRDGHQRSRPWPPHAATASATAYRVRDPDLAAAVAVLPVRNGDGWPEPKPLLQGLLSVDSFDLDFVPSALKPWIDDVATRLQCPPDYVAVAAIVALGSALGRRVGIKPQARTDWVEISNIEPGLVDLPHPALGQDFTPSPTARRAQAGTGVRARSAYIWGGFIGRPGMLKSPAMQEALKPLHRLEAEAGKENDLARKAYEDGISAHKLRQQVKISLEKNALKKAKGGNSNVEFELGEEPKKPAAVRYRTNDSSYEALGELLRDNPAGILVERDELVSLLKHLDREEQVVARGFFLSGWSGQQPYSFDRIGRGHIDLDAVCLSVLGGTQPARIAEYVRRANLGGAGGDGLIQRFGLLVWPDVSVEWRDVDEYPRGDARERAWQVFERATKLDLSAALKLGASKDQYDKVPCFRFDDPARDDFLGWRTDLETRLRSGELSPALEGHLAKYRKLVPALALINHISDSDEGDVSQKSLVRALGFATYLESHAKRVYSSTSEGETSAASAILRRIKAKSLTDGFTARDILRHGWAHLTDREQIGAGLNLLVELDYLVAVESTAAPSGGRPKVTYAINPRVPLQ